MKPKKIRSIFLVSSILITPLPFLLINKNDGINSVISEDKQSRGFSDTILINATLDKITPLTNDDNYSERMECRADAGGWGQTVTTKREKQYQYNLNLKSPLKKYYIGEFDKMNFYTNKPFYENTNIYIDYYEQNVNWNLETGKVSRNLNFGLLSEINKDSSIYNSSLDFKLKQFSSNYTRKGFYEIWQGSDYGKISHSTRISFNNSNLNLELIQRIKLENQDLSEALVSHWPYSNGFINILNNRPYFSINVTTNYSRNDVVRFKELFKQILTEPIRINSRNPVLFDYLSTEKPNSYNENETKIRKMLDERVKQFYRNGHILNKLGYVSDINGNSTGATSIELIVPESIRGTAGSKPKEVKVRLKLRPNETFYFDENEAKNYIELILPIYLEIDPNINLDLNKFIRIDPYNSASDQIHDNWVTKRDLNFILGENDPNPFMIKSFSKNINEAKYGLYPIVPIEKFPAINKYGMILEMNLEIDLGDRKIIEKISFNRIYNNGKTFKTINIDENKFGNIKIKDLKIELGLEMNKDKINIFNAQPIELQSSLGPNEMKNVRLKIKDVRFTLPKEQYLVKSKWVREKEPIYNDTNNNKNTPDFMGQWKTYDPFKFSMVAQVIPVYDPITGELLGHASKYKPFIRKGLYNPNTKVNSKNNEDISIFPKPNDGSNSAVYEADFGSYFMKNKQENGKLSLQIVIKEYDEKNQTYSKDVWIMSVNMELLNDQATFVMTGFNENDFIKKENEERYFNKEHIDYRGDFANEKTGMYIPKIVWVNSYPPESFLYDPLDENGKLISNQQSNDPNNLRYDIGYIAQLNSTAFSSDDYKPLPTFGGYDTIFNVDIFNPTGLVPYSEFYKFNKNSIIPSVERYPLSKSGLQTIKSDSNFRQIVLKRPSSNVYLYQFVKIAQTSEIKTYKGDLIGLYGNYKGLKNQPLFVDFWETYHGKNLKKYLVDENKLIESEDALKELEYFDVIQYWNIYVNDPKNTNSDNSTSDQDKTSEYDISKIMLNQINVSANELDILRKVVEDQIQAELNHKLDKKGWISLDKPLKVNVHFTIELNEYDFIKKLEILKSQYSLALNQAKKVEFNIIIKEESFKNELIKISGKNTISIFNNKDADKIIDLSNYNGGKIQINTSKEPFISSNNLVDDVKKIIYDSINLDWIKIIKNSNLDLGENFIPQLNVHYELEFYSKIYKENQLINQYYPTIEKAINDVILYQINQPFFDNNLYVRIVAKENDQTNFMKNSFTKLVNNNANNPNLNFIDAFDLNKIKAKDIKINTKDPNFPEKDQLNQPQFIFDLIKERVRKDINFWARKWINLNKESIDYDLDYKIKFIKSIDSFGNYIYFDNELDAIKQILLTNLEQNFNRDLYIEVSASKNEKNYKTRGKFIKKINNNYLNKAIEEDKYDDTELDDSLNDGNGGSIDSSIDNPTEQSKNNNLNKAPIENKINYWWIITPTTILFIIITSAIIVFVIRKNRRIR